MTISVVKKILKNIDTKSLFGPMSEIFRKDEKQKKIEIWFQVFDYNFRHSVIISNHATVVIRKIL